MTDPSRRTVLGLVAFAVVTIVALYLVLPQLAGLEDTWDRIDDGRPLFLVLCAAGPLIMFGGFVWQFGRTYAAARLSYRESLQITLAALAASRIFSAGGAGGLVLQAWALRKKGMAPREVSDRTVCFIVTQYLLYTGAVALFGLGEYLTADGPFALTLLPAAVAIAVTAFGLSIGFVPPDLQRRIPSRLAEVPASASTGIRAALSAFGRADRTVAGAVLFWVGQIVCLWAAFEAFGESPPFAVLVLGFYLGMLGNLLPLPGGVGGVDGGMIGAFVAFGLDADLVVVAVLAFRAFTFWLPTLPGVLAFLALRRTVARWDAVPPAAPTYTL